METQLPGLRSVLTMKNAFRWALLLGACYAIGMIICMQDLEYKTLDDGSRVDQFTRLSIYTRNFSWNPLISSPIPMSRYGTFIIWMGMLLHGINTFFIDNINALTSMRVFSVALFAFTIAATYHALKKIGYSTDSSLLGSSLLFGFIHLGGASFSNVKDGPAACAFLLTTFALWFLTQKAEKVQSVALFIMIGLTAIFPFLVRPPLLLHFVLALIIVAMLAIRNMRRGTRTIIPHLQGLMIVFATALALLFYLMPSARSEMKQLGFVGMLQTYIKYFGNYPAHAQWAKGLPDTFRQFDISGLLREGLNFFNPVVLAVTFAGILLYAAKKRHASRRGKKVNALGFAMTFDEWTVLVILLSIFSIGVLSPRIGDNTRYILFSVTPISVLAAYGLDHLPGKIKRGLIALIIVSSATTYAQWGRYAYVHQSPLTPMFFPRYAWKGDYFGSCYSQGFRHLDQGIRESRTVKVNDTVMFNRLNHPGFPYPVIKESNEKIIKDLFDADYSGDPYYVLLLGIHLSKEELRRILANPNHTIFYSVTTPNNVTICLAAEVG